MTNKSLSHKNLVSGGISLLLGIVLAVSLFLALTGQIGAIASVGVLTNLGFFFAVSLLLSVIIESNLVPRIKKPTVMRILLLYYAASTFLIVIISAMLYFFSYQDVPDIAAVALTLFVIGFYVWLMFAVAATIGRLIYPHLHKALWKTPLN
jgi:uncharacterized membrane protein